MKWPGLCGHAVCFNNNDLICRYFSLKKGSRTHRVKQIRSERGDARKKDSRTLLQLASFWERTYGTVFRHVPSQKYPWPYLRISQNHLMHSTYHSNCMIWGFHRDVSLDVLRVNVPCSLQYWRWRRWNVGYKPEDYVGCNRTEGNCIIIN
jgi:hypothetical protein